MRKGEKQNERSAFGWPWALPERFRAPEPREGRPSLFPGSRPWRLSAQPQGSELRLRVSVPPLGLFCATSKMCSKISGKPRKGYSLGLKHPNFFLYKSMVIVSSLDTVSAEKGCIGRLYFQIPGETCLWRRGGISLPTTCHSYLVIKLLSEHHSLQFKRHFEFNLQIVYWFLPKRN